MTSLWVAGCGGGLEANEDLARSIEVETEQVDGAVAESSSLPVDPESILWCRTGAHRGRVVVDADALAGVSVYQGVEVPLFPFSDSVDLVSGRDALVRVFVSNQTEEPPDGARLVIRDAGGELVFEDVRPLVGSKRASLKSTYNFFLEGGVITPTTEVRVELFRDVSCDEAGRDGSGAFPVSGFYPLSAREVGALELMIVPIQFDADGSGRRPGLTETRLEEFRRALLALYPVPEVILQVHETVATERESLDAILSQVMLLRAAEAAPANRAYFGFVNPAATMEDYCAGSCVAGVSAVGSASGASSSGVGVGFVGTALETFLHELGHIHRLDHAPCGQPSGLDDNFPHEDGRLGSWGFDMRDRSLKDPEGNGRDFMSYCDPTWISDYNYQRLVDRISFTNSALL